MMIVIFSETKITFTEVCSGLESEEGKKNVNHVKLP